MFRDRSRLVLPLLLPWLAGVPLFASGPDLSILEAKFDRVIQGSRGQVGVSLIHVESGATLAIHGAQRFPMASVYKLPIALELLTQVSQGTIAMNREVTLGPSDIRACCILSRHHPLGGVTITAGELLQLMIVESDTPASDAVMNLVGGPAVVERRMRALGFNAINVNRYEGDINFEMTGVLHPPPQPEWTLELQYRLISEVTPEALREARARYTSDPRDTSTPDDMARLLGRLQLGNLLPPHKKKRPRSLIEPVSKGVEQDRQQRVHASERRPERGEAFAESVREQTVEHVLSPRDHVDGHVPWRGFAADRRRRLMIAEQDHHEVAIGALAQVALDRREVVGHRLDVAGPEVFPVRLSGVRAHDVGTVVRSRRRDAASSAPRSCGDRGPRSPTEDSDARATIRHRTSATPRRPTRRRGRSRESPHRAARGLRRA